MGIQPLLKVDPKLSTDRTVIVEVGGGSTEVLVVRAGNVLFSNTYRLGSLRLLETLEKFDAPLAKQRAIMGESQIQRVVETDLRARNWRLASTSHRHRGDVRFAANHLLTDWHSGSLGELSVDALNDFARQMLRMSDDEIVQRYGVSFKMQRNNCTGAAELCPVCSWVPCHHTAHR